MAFPARRGLPLLLLAAVSCTTDGRGRGPDRPNARFDQPEQAQLALRALVCERDSVAAITGTGERWGLALGVSAAWPLGDSMSLPVGTTLGAIGTASFAAREQRDTVVPGFTGRSGEVLLSRRGDFLWGSFNVLAVGAVDDTVQFSGRLDSVPVTLAACP